MNQLNALLAILLLIPVVAFSQTDEEYVKPYPRNYDYVYLPNIKSVQFRVGQLENSYPIINLGQTDGLMLEFDDLDADFKYYYYTVIHCNADWTPSEGISQFDYLDGFLEEEITDYEYSQNVTVPYTHYRLSLPNKYTKFKLSGNYLLKIYLNNDPNDLVITRRFMVTEEMVTAMMRPQKSSDVSTLATHQEVAVTVKHKDFRIANPANELRVVVLQNGRWDNAKLISEPTFQMAEELIFNSPGQISFAGLREFRPLDIRSLQTRSNQVEFITSDKYRWDVHLFSDRPKANSTYMFSRDLDGSYFIESFETNADASSADYAFVHFSLKSPYLKDKNVYVTGSFADWRPAPRYRMDYNKEKEQYEVAVELKQGYYDYTYGVTEKEASEVLDLEYVDGGSFETQNKIQTLLYFRGFGARFDRLVGTAMMSTY